MGSTLYFQADDGVNGSELWKSDGTAAGTVLVKDIQPGSPGSGPSYLTAVGSTLYFQADDGVNGKELWKSDGTAAGTVMVRDIRPGGSGSEPSYLTTVGSTLYFRASTSTTGMELWKSDGTAAGTVMVKDIRPGYSSSEPAYITALENKVFFSANDGLNGTELWTSDGTAGGTVLVKDICPGSYYSDPYKLTVVGNTLYFLAKYQGFPSKSGLFKSDGTAAGTILIMDGYIPSLIGAGSRHLWFSGFLSSSHGRELLITDGTTAGTRMVADVNPGPPSSNPTIFPLSSGKLFFSAEHQTSGRELWCIDPGATAQPVGSGRSTVGAPPALRATDPVLGSTMTVTLDGAPSGTAGYLLLCPPAPQPYDLGNGYLAYVDPTFIFFFSGLKPNTQGKASLFLPVPNVPALDGYRFMLQAWVGPTGSPYGIDFSNGVYLTLGI